MTNEARAGEGGQVGSRVGGGRATKLALSTPVGRLARAVGLWAGRERRQDQRGGGTPRLFPPVRRAPWSQRCSAGVCGAASAHWATLGRGTRTGRPAARAQLPPAARVQRQPLQAAGEHVLDGTTPVSTAVLQDHSGSVRDRATRREHEGAGGSPHRIAAHSLFAANATVTEQQHQRYGKAARWAPRRPPAFLDASSS